MIFSLKIFKDYVTGVVPQCYLLIPKVSAIAPDLRVAAAFAEPDIPDSDILVALMEE